MVFSIPGALLSWRWPAPVDLALLSEMGIMGAATQAFYIRGMAAGAAAAVGFFLFAEIPTVWTILGAAEVAAVRS
ncbi:MAG: hypothetical protein ACOYKF_05160 [Phenylobacterium sp.]